ncbi:MAG: ornithine carbamoyltransferase [Candidatus Micrarchaeia archaeon]
MHLLGIDSLSKEDIERIFDIADGVKAGRSTISIKEGAVLALLFQKGSISTRVALEVAMSKLGGRSIFLDASDYKSGQSSLNAIGRTLGSYVDLIAARLCSHDDLIELAEGSPVPVINAMTNIEHPLSALADLYTIKEKKKYIKGLKIGMTGNAELGTFNSLMLGAAKLGAKISIASPEGISINPIYLVKAREYTIVDTYTDPSGVEDADVVYVDCFVQDHDETKEKALASYDISGKAKESQLVVRASPIYKVGIEDIKSASIEQMHNRLYIAQAVILFLSETSM